MEDSEPEAGELQAAETESKPDELQKTLSGGIAYRKDTSKRPARSNKKRKSGKRKERTPENRRMLLPR